MPGDDFEPGEPKLPAGQPLNDYLQPPSGLGMLATGQFVLAGLVVLLAVTAVRHGEHLSVGLVLSTLIPAALLCGAGLGLLLRVGWGWWLTASLYYCAFFNLPVNLALWTIRQEPFGLGANLVVCGLAIVVLAYLTRQELLRFIQFGSRDGRASPAMLWSPAVAGLLWAALRLIVTMVG